MNILDLKKNISFERILWIYFLIESTFHNSMKIQNSMDIQNS